MSIELLPTLATAASKEGLFKEIYGDLAKPGVSQVGKAIATVLGLGNTALWPVQLLNEKARLAMERNLESYREKMKSVPTEDVIQVASEVGVPILEKLSYVEDADLRELYTNLLAAASNARTVAQAHPSFVNIINNLSPDEAQMVAYFKRARATPFVQVRFTSPNSTWMEIEPLAFLLPSDVKLAFPVNLNAYVSNLQGLGLLAIPKDEYVVPISVYEPLEASIREKYAQLTPPPDYPSLTLHRGRINVTQFGALFIHACTGS